MKNENMNWNTARRIVLVILGIFSLFMFAACSDGSGGGGGGKTIVTRYGYRLNFNNTYHRVSKYTAYDNDDNTYEVINCELHFFAISNSNYKNRTGVELCDMVKMNAVEPSSSQEYTVSQDTYPTINTSTGEKDVFHMKEGLTYTAYYYF